MTKDNNIIIKYWFVHSLTFSLPMYLEPPFKTFSKNYDDLYVKPAFQIITKVFFPYFYKVSRIVFNKNNSRYFIDLETK